MDREEKRKKFNTIYDISTIIEDELCKYGRKNPSQYQDMKYESGIECARFGIPAEIAANKIYNLLILGGKNC